MTINVTFTNETVAELQSEMSALLAGTALGTNTVATPGTNKPASGRTRGKAETQNISTGDERKDPTDSAADQAQDAKDEADETAKNAAKAAADAASKAEAPKLTLANVKTMLGGYVMQFGMEAAQADGEAFIGAKKMSDIPDTQEAYAKAILAIAQGIEKNPNKREMADDGITAEKLAELKPIVAAAKAVK